MQLADKAEIKERRFDKDALLLRLNIFLLSNNKMVEPPHWITAL